MGKLPPKSLVRIWKKSVCFQGNLTRNFPNYFAFKNLAHLRVGVKCPEIPLCNNAFELNTSLGPNFLVKIIAYHKIYLIHAARGNDSIMQDSWNLLCH